MKQCMCLNRVFSVSPASSCLHKHCIVFVFCVAVPSVLAMCGGF